MASGSDSSEVSVSLVRIQSNGSSATLHSLQLKVSLCTLPCYVAHMAILHCSQHNTKCNLRGLSCLQSTCHAGCTRGHFISFIWSSSCFFSFRSYSIKCHPPHLCTTIVFYLGCLLFHHNSLYSCSVKVDSWWHIVMHSPPCVFICGQTALCWSVYLQTPLHSANGF